MHFDLLQTRPSRLFHTVFDFAAMMPGWCLSVVDSWLETRDFSTSLSNYDVTPIAMHSVIECYRPNIDYLFVSFLSEPIDLHPSLESTDPISIHHTRIFPPLKALSSPTSNELELAPPTPPLIKKQSNLIFHPGIRYEHQPRNIQ